MATVTVQSRINPSGGTAWRVRYRHQGKQPSLTFEAEADAREFQRLIREFGVERAFELLRERGSADRAKKPSPTLAEYGHAAVDARAGIDAATRQRYHRQIDTVLGSLAKMPIDAVTHDDVRSWVNRTAAAKHTDGRPRTSGKTLSNRRGLLSSIFKEAQRDRLVTANPCIGIRISRTVQREMTFLTSAEFAHVLAHTRSFGSGMVALLAATGLRFGEASALQLRDVDFGSGTLTVSRAWKESEDDEPAADGLRAKRKRVLGPPKSRKSRRTIHVPPQVLAILRVAAEGLADDDFIFRTPGRTEGARDWLSIEGVPWTHDKFGRRVWAPAIEAARSEALHEGDDRTCHHSRLAKEPASTTCATQPRLGCSPAARPLRRCRGTWGTSRSRRRSTGMGTSTRRWRGRPRTLRRRRWRLRFRSLPTCDDGRPVRVPRLDRGAPGSGRRRGCACGAEPDPGEAVRPGE